jgi:hypothetical protein
MSDPVCISSRHHVPQHFQPFRYFQQYLYAMQTFQKLKITTPDIENQADYG